MNIFFFFIGIYMKGNYLPSRTYQTKKIKTKIKTKSLPSKRQP